MFQELAHFALLAAPCIGVAVLLYVLIRSVLNYGGAERRRGYIIFKAAASVAIWLAASWVMLWMLFFAVYAAANVEDRAAAGRGAFTSILFLDLVYALLGCGLCLWIWHRPGNRQRTISTGGAI
jgi:hypothetical protein